jgi:hypothetical protein
MIVGALQLHCGSQTRRARAPESQYGTRSCSLASTRRARALASTCTASSNRPAQEFHAGSASEVPYASLSNAAEGKLEERNKMTGAHLAAVLLRVCTSLLNLFYRVYKHLCTHRSKEKCAPSLLLPIFSLLPSSMASGLPTLCTPERLGVESANAAHRLRPTRLQKPCACRELAECGPSRAVCTRDGG